MSQVTPAPDPPVDALPRPPPPPSGAPGAPGLRLPRPGAGLPPPPRAPEPPPPQPKPLPPPPGGSAGPRRPDADPPSHSESSSPAPPPPAGPGRAAKVRGKMGEASAAARHARDWARHRRDVAWGKIMTKTGILFDGFCKLFFPSGFAAQKALSPGDRQIFKKFGLFPWNWSTLVRMHRCSCEGSRSAKECATRLLTLLHLDGHSGHKLLQRVLVSVWEDLGIRDSRLGDEDSDDDDDDDILGIGGRGSSFNVVNDDGDVVGRYRDAAADGEASDAGGGFLDDEEKGGEATFGDGRRRRRCPVDLRSFALGIANLLACEKMALHAIVFWSYDATARRLLDLASLVRMIKDALGVKPSMNGRRLLKELDGLLAARDAQTVRAHRLLVDNVVTKAVDPSDRSLCFYNTATRERTGLDSGLPSAPPKPQGFAEIQALLQSIDDISPAAFARFMERRAAGFWPIMRAQRSLQYKVFGHWFWARATRRLTALLNRHYSQERDFFRAWQLLLKQQRRPTSSE